MIIYRLNHFVNSDFRRINRFTALLILLGKNPNHFLKFVQQKNHSIEWLLILVEAPRVELGSDGVFANSSTYIVACSFYKSELSANDKESSAVQDWRSIILPLATIKQSKHFSVPKTDKVRIGFLGFCYR